MSPRQRAREICLRRMPGSAPRRIAVRAAGAREATWPGHGTRHGIRIRVGVSYLPPPSRPDPLAAPGPAWPPSPRSSGPGTAPSPAPTRSTAPQADAAIGGSPSPGRRASSIHSGSSASRTCWNDSGRGRCHHLPECRTKLHPIPRSSPPFLSPASVWTHYPFLRTPWPIGIGLRPPAVRRGIAGNKRMDLPAVPGWFARTAGTPWAAWGCMHPRERRRAGWERNVRWGRADAAAWGPARASDRHPVHDNVRPAAASRGGGPRASIDPEST
jgi:hypothetical protein